MKPKVLLSRKWPAPCEERLSRDYDVTLNDADVALSAAELRAAMDSYDAVCVTVTDTVGADVIHKNQRARIIGNFGVGVNHIDLDAAKAAGVAVSNTPDVLTEATADMAITLMLSAARRSSEGERQLRRGAWESWTPTHLLGRGLRGKTLGIIGMGRIGQEVARIAQTAFSMKIVYYNRSEKPGGERLGTVAEVMERADVVSLHVPGGAGTDGLIGAEELALLGPEGMLINTARGTVVDEPALIAALQEGKLGSAGLDVFAQEPHVPEELRVLENVVLAPHMGSAVVETRVAMGMMVADALDAHFAGREIPNRLV
ncbi:2-hydroxyacid dehydrogenase [Palleronia caenipelagi]|uniref:D-glycerate dehydrogenase n=1 Tax=Palleronia caenipelagi TaxID=2489174 RepID=A0A547QAZ6_9RHOB|nr:D-glycerate dehydrogenase [Palleronia caenipelagi]TRD23571.1 D-glycerate dehydrogenase [Palleronia caenipelagi]